MKSATDISKAVLPQRKYPTSDNRGQQGKRVMCSKVFMDYLSFLTLRLENCPKYPELERQDYMVLNSVANVSKALYPLGSYERIHCFFDNDRAGMEALQQIRMEYGRDLYIRDASQTYSGCKDLNEYLQKQAERNRQVQSAKGVRSQPPKKKTAFGIAHYNYTLRFRSCGLSRGAYGSALRTRQRLSALCNPTKE